MSKKKTPPSYGEPSGPNIVDTHSKMSSPFGPAEQLHGGSMLISASSFWILRDKVKITRTQRTMPRVRWFALAMTRTARSQHCASVPGVRAYVPGV